MVSEKPWTVESAMLLFAALFGCILIGGSLGALIAQVIPAVVLSRDMVTLLTGTLSFHGAAFLLIHFLLRRCDISWKSAFGFNRSGKLRAVALALVVGVACLPLAWGLGHISSEVLESLGQSPSIQDPVRILKSTGDWETRIAVGVLSIFVAPFAEELLFRGVLYPAIRQRGHPRLAFWSTALLFAMLHSSLVLFLPLVFLAAMFTLLYEATENLLAPIIAHAVFNLANFLLMIREPASA